MLQQKEISRLLSQAVASDTSQGTVHAACLLAANGLPLITVVPSVSPLSQDKLRMYSLLAVSLHNQQAKTGDPNIDNWDLLVLDTNLKASLKTIGSSDGNAMFLSLFYSADFSDASSKARLDSVAGELASGLAGYKASQ